MFEKMTAYIFYLMSKTARDEKAKVTGFNI